MSKKINLKNSFDSPKQVISNEGFVDNFKNYFSRLFTTQKEITKNIHSLRARPVKEQTKLHDVPWAKVFNKNQNTVVTGSRIIEVLKEHSRVRDDLIKEGAELLDKVLEAVTFSVKLKFEDRKRYEALLKIKRALEDTSLRIEDEFPKFIYKKQITDVMTGNESEIKEIISWLDDRENNTKAISTFNKFIDQITAAYDTIMVVYAKEIYVQDEDGSYKRDIVYEKSATDDHVEEIILLAWDIFDDIHERAYSYENNFRKFVHGCYMYVKASV